MLVETKKGKFKLERNFRNAFVKETFEEKYIEECFDRYLYLVGDISSGILRLKGFDANPRSKNYYQYMDDYLESSCAMGCPYYVLKRLKTTAEVEKVLKEKTPVDEDGIKIRPLIKESFDRESLILESSLKEKPSIRIDTGKINRLPKADVPLEIKEYIEQDTMGNKNNTKQPEKPVNTTSYISTSPGFVPNQNKNHYYHQNKNRNKKKK